jgi:hypothetical protein
MATFLQLCQDLADECLINRDSLTTVSGQTGQLGDVVRWVSKAYKELQNRHAGQWSWLRHDFTLTTGFELDFTGGGITEIAAGDQIDGLISGASATINRVVLRTGTWAGGDAAGTFRFTAQTGTFEAEGVEVSGSGNLADIAGDSSRSGIYDPSDAVDGTTNAAIDRYSSWYLSDPDTPPKIYLTSSGRGGETWLTWTPWEWFRSIYLMGNNALITAYPGFIAVDPQDNIRLGAIPNANYTISGEYYRRAQVLANDDDIPEMPEQYHDLIVYLGMRKYAGSESAQEVMTRAYTEGNPLMVSLETNQLTGMSMTGPLA